jgi:hypothetical protein
MTTKFEEKYYVYLDNLRDSGVTNMFGAGSYLVDEFPELNKHTARNVLMDWMDTFGERHKTEGE